MGLKTKRKGTPINNLGHMSLWIAFRKLILQGQGHEKGDLVTKFWYSLKSFHHVVFMLQLLGCYNFVLPMPIQIFQVVCSYCVPMVVKQT